LNIKILVVATVLMICPTFGAGQDLCGSIADQEPPYAEATADAASRLMSDSVAAGRDDSEVGADEVDYVLRMSALPGTYAEAVESFLRQKPPSPGTISPSDMAAWQ